MLVKKSSTGSHLARDAPHAEPAPDHLVHEGHGVVLLIAQLMRQLQAAPSELTPELLMFYNFPFSPVALGCTVGW